MSEEDRKLSATVEFLELLRSLGFADAYYALCASHTIGGPEIPFEIQIGILKETGRAFRYDKKEKFFAWRDGNAPDGCELGLNIKFSSALVEWILVFGTPVGHLGSVFPRMAANEKRLLDPAYKHSPPAPHPQAATKAELAEVIDEGLALYDKIAEAIIAKTWG